MRTLRAYELPNRLKLSAYENKRGGMNIKIEIPVPNSHDNACLIAPVAGNDAHVATVFDGFIEIVKSYSKAETVEAFLIRFIPDVNV